MEDSPVKVVDKIYIGSVKTPLSNNLDKYDIKTIINLSGVEYESDIKTIDIKIPDVFVNLEHIGVYMETFAIGVAALEVGLNKGNVLIHCMQGVNRAVFLIALYLANIGYDYDKIISNIKRANDKRKVKMFTNPSFH